MIVLLNAGLKETSSYLWFFVVKKNLYLDNRRKKITKNTH